MRSHPRFARFADERCARCKDGQEPCDGAPDGDAAPTRAQAISAQPTFRDRAGPAPAAHHFHCTRCGGLVALQLPRGSRRHLMLIHSRE